MNYITVNLPFNVRVGCADRCFATSRGTHDTVDRKHMDL
jgi:hypothetical protein